MSNEFVFFLEGLLSQFMIIPVWNYAIALLVAVMGVGALFKWRRRDKPQGPRTRNLSFHMMNVVAGKSRKKRAKIINQTSIKIDDQMLQRLKELLTENQKIAAIKMVRESYKMDLTTAKQVVDALEQVDSKEDTF